MNTTTYKKLGMIALLGAIIVPQFTFAASPLAERRAANINNEKGAAQFCANLSTRADGWSSRIDAKTAKVDMNRNEHINKKIQNRADRDTRLDQHRDGWDNNRNARFTKLEAKATTDVQKAAVAEFKATVTTGITARRAAIDAAIAVFRSGVDALNTQNKSAIDTAISNFKTAYQAALTKATADCAAGIDSKTVKTTFEASVKTASDTFKTAKDTIIKKSAVETLAVTRKTSVTKAISDFKVVLQTAQQKLQLAFPK
jgi:hypothetical protein